MDLSEIRKLQIRIKRSRSSFYRTYLIFVNTGLGAPCSNKRGGGAFLKPREAEAANRFYRVPQQQLSLVA
ncbi:conserved hypothetical protein [Ricinus communis]|uniref:Uncharacterized protein n=1 Tax=Ricinus communis TaxID=3988 RepID=B9T908_RICCO|nr:conserved hypothetical protein [Ricinus communis]